MATTKTKKINMNSKSSSTSVSKVKLVAGAIGVAVVAGGAGYVYNDIVSPPGSIYTISNYRLKKAKRMLNSLEVRTDNEAPVKYDTNGYASSGWVRTGSDNCETRYNILADSLDDANIVDKCEIQSGQLFDYYTGETVSLSSGIDIDHIVAKKNAWDSGGYLWDKETWAKYINDEDRVLIATSYSANRSKGGKDAADWLPENTEYWCKYVIQQIEIKDFYNLSVRQAEKDKMQEVLAENCKTK